MLGIHTAKTRWSPIFDIYFQIWNMLQSFLIVRLPVAMATVKKANSMVMSAMYSHVIYPSLVNMQHVVFELRLFSGVANIEARGAEYPPWQRKIYQRSGKRGRNREKRKNREEKAKIGKVLSLCPSWQNDRTGYATAFVTVFNQ